MPDLDTILRQGAAYLEQHRRCPKHRVEHTGSECYLLDFYTELGEVEKGKELIRHLLSLIVADGESKVFYPGRLDPMNMSNSAIDSGSAVDAISRFVRLHAESFTSEQYADIVAKVREVVETYLATPAADKPITNQRLWALTGIASFARLAAEESKYRAFAAASIERAFADMTPDGFFRYSPGDRHPGYDGITEFYQSRHSAFIRYVLAELGMNAGPYEARLAQADRALLALYEANGIKDLRLECKRWYWQSAYEVAATGFDTYALAHATEPAAPAALHNALYQLRAHFRAGYLHSDQGYDINFQCPIFWTAHLAWMLRIENIRERVAEARALVPFSYTFKGREVFIHTTPEGRMLIDARWMPRNPSTGIFDNGLPDKAHWAFKIPTLPPGLGFSFRETANHIFYALRGGHLREATIRKLLFIRECIVMVLPRYSERYGKIEQLEYEDGRVTGLVTPASKYGTLHGRARRFSVQV